MEYNDDILIYYIRLNNKTAYDMLYAKYLRITKSILLNKINFRLVCKNEVEDFVQDCFLLFNKAIATYCNEEGTFYNYFYSIIYNVFLTCIKEITERRSKTIYECDYEDKDASLFNYLSDSIDYIENYSIKEERNFLIKNGKNKIENDVLFLKQEGYSYKEIHLLLGISLKQIDYILTNSKKKLRKFYD